MENIFYYNLDNGDMLKEVIVKIRLGRINIQKEMTVKALLDSGITGLVMSLELVKKKGLKLKKIERSIYMRNVVRVVNNGLDSISFSF